MKELKIAKDEIIEYEKLKIVSELVSIKGKVELFEKKYKISFNGFSKKMRKIRNEDFAVWDDFIEWKAYLKTLEELKQKIKDIDSAENITVT